MLTRNRPAWSCARGIGFDVTKMLGKHRARDPALRRAARTPQEEYVEARAASSPPSSTPEPRPRVRG